jgi:uncharacterized membrane protein YeaQ/YmgE (transglycosylase-associated protein family)
MNIAVYCLAGGIAGWLAFAVVGYNAERGLMISLAMGAAGALIGGQVIAPSLVSAAAAQTGVSMPAMIIALAASATCLFVANHVQKRWGI